MPIFLLLFLAVVYTADTIAGAQENAARSAKSTAAAGGAADPAATQRRDLANKLYQSGSFESAAREWKSLVDSGRRDANDSYWLGEAYYHLHRYRDAAKSFGQAIELNGKMDNVRVRQVQAYLADKNRAQAQSACAAALPVVADPYARKQLETLAKITSSPRPLLPPVKLSTGQIEQANQGK